MLDKNFHGVWKLKFFLKKDFLWWGRDLEEGRRWEEGEKGRGGGKRQAELATSRLAH